MGDFRGMKLTIRYSIYELQNGLLIEPTTYYNSRVFDWSYESQDQALQAIEDKHEEYPPDYIILPVSSRKWSDEL